MCVVLVIVSLSLALGLAGVRLHLRSSTEVRNQRGEIAVLKERLAARSREVADARRAGQMHADALSEATRSRAALLSDIAEMMRGPLNAVVGFSDVMSAAVHGFEAQDQALGRIRAAAFALRTLAARIGDMAEADRPDATLTYKPLDPGLIVRQVCARLAGEAAAAGVSLRSPKPRPGVTVLADPDRVAVIVVELVRNALRHTRPGGAVLLETTPVGDGVGVSVHDTGEGIAAERLGNIFQAFGKAGGRRGGLGLAIAYRTARAMGGGLAATSLPGEGSTFTLTLPSARPKAEPGQCSLAMIVQPTTLLYVDGDQTSALLMRQAARLMGPVQAYVADTAAEGLELARSLRPDVIIVDLDLPDAPGAALKRQLSLEPLTRTIPTIAVSTSAPDRALRLAVEEGFAEHLGKPLDLRDLTKAVERLVGRAASPSINLAA